MKRSVVVALGFLVVLSSSNALALGLGGYLDGGFGFYQLDKAFVCEDRYCDVDELDIDVEAKTRNFGIGFALDTAVARDTIFNYRLRLGYVRTWLEPENEFLDTINANGFIFDNAFGFGIIRSDAVRFWIGPSVRLSTIFYDEDEAGWDFGLAFGPQAGVNIHTGDAFSIGLGFGYQYNFIFHLTGDGNRDLGYVDGATGHEHLLTLNVTFLFRTGGDRFQQ